MRTANSVDIPIFFLKDCRKIRICGQSLEILSIIFKKYSHYVHNI
ncbi:hypothetical protein HMPREF0742_02067 [Rothia aeria F0184]|uniref:Uncharacterized protein n=1 Tax=Rothia aeria F0184 TaxID=888019 RepID=U7V0L1_9MICC|nr:hypothetical protein HMPREF0742_02067 [Rothia aeria F0184]